MVKKFIKTIKHSYLSHQLADAQLKGKFKPFDDNFFRMLEGKYYNGVPVYYYLKDMSLGKCYDASAILGLALGEGCTICRGNLISMENFWGKDYTGHGWIEKDGLVYDTTMQMICDKQTYYKILKVTNVSSRPYQQFFQDCQGLSDWTIHTKSWYENNYSPANIFIFQVRELAKLKLKIPSCKDEQDFYLKLLTDLPAEEKTPLMPEQER